jgi:hypothetical protein
MVCRYNFMHSNPQSFSPALLTVNLQLGNTCFSFVMNSMCVTLTEVKLRTANKGCLGDWTLQLSEIITAIVGTIVEYFIIITLLYYITVYYIIRY